MVASLLFVDKLVDGMICFSQRESQIIHVFCNNDILGRSVQIWCLSKCCFHLPIALCLFFVKRIPQFSAYFYSLHQSVARNAELLVELPCFWRTPQQFHVVKILSGVFLSKKKGESAAPASVDIVPYSAALHPAARHSHCIHRLQNRCSRLR